MEKHDESKSLSGWASFKRVLCYAALICSAVLVVGFVCLCLSLRSGIRHMGDLAVQEYPGDRIEALMAYVESENHSLRERNRAVWALGMIGDRRALPLMEKSWTGKPCDHDTTLCQGEVGKAIKKCRGNSRFTAWLFG